MNPKDKDMAEQALQVAKMAVGVCELARQCGVSAPSVSQWTVTPVRRVLDVERITGVSRHLLRPDIYPKEAGE